MSLAGCQISLIDVNFHIQKSFESFHKDSADKIQSKKDKEIKLPSLMPIRVKYRTYAHAIITLGFYILNLHFECKKPLFKGLSFLTILPFYMVIQ